MKHKNTCVIFFAYILLAQVAMINAMQKPDWKKELAPLFEVKMVANDETQFIAYCDQFDEQKKINDPQAFYNYLGDYVQTEGFFSLTAQNNKTLLYTILHCKEPSIEVVNLLMTNDANIHKIKDMEELCNNWGSTEFKIFLLHKGAIFSLITPSSDIAINNLNLLICTLSRLADIKTLEHLVNNKEKFFNNNVAVSYFINTCINLRQLKNKNAEKSYTDSSTQTLESMFDRQASDMKFVEEESAKISESLASKEVTVDSVKLNMQKLNHRKPQQKLTMNDWMNTWDTW